MKYLMFIVVDPDHTDAEAIELVARNPMAYEGRIELRPIHSMGGPQS